MEFITCKQLINLTVIMAGQAIINECTWSLGQTKAIIQEAYGMLDKLKNMSILPEGKINDCFVTPSATKHAKFLLRWLLSKHMLLLHRRWK